MHSPGEGGKRERVGRVRGRGVERKEKREKREGVGRGVEGGPGS